MTAVPLAGRDSRPTVCVTSPVWNEEEVLPAFVSEMSRVRDCCGEDLFLLLIDDGSTDRTWNIIEKVCLEHSWIGGVRLSRNFGHQAALCCGYRLARGEAVISLDADLQDPPEVILEMLAKWRAGADVVTAVRSCRRADSFFKRTSAGFFYWLIERIGQVQAPRHAGDFRLLSRRAVDALNLLQEGSVYLRGLVGWIGFPTATVQYQRPARPAGTSKFPFWKMLRFATDSIASFSTAPLKLSYALSLVLFLVLAVYGIYSAAAVMFFNRTLEAGWLSLIASVTIIGCANLLCLGVIGEYVGRIYLDGKRRPLYLVAERCNPQVS